MKDITIMTTANLKYIEYFYVFLKSAAVNFPQAKIYAVLVNVPKLPKIEEAMKSANPNLHIKYEKKEFSLKKALAADTDVDRSAWEWQMRSPTAAEAI